MAADCRRKAPNRPDTTLSGAEGGAKGSTPRNSHRCSSTRFTPARPSRRSELLPSRFAWVHAHPTVEIPRFRFATLGMTEQFTIHNYSARSCCHLERSVSGVERSRHNRTFILAKHPRCSQPTKDETFECSPSPGVAADCRRRASNRPAVTLSEASAEPKGLDMEKHSPLRFARGHADPAVGIPRLRFATLGMTEQCTIHNYSARSCCHVERRGASPAAETSRRCGTFAITIRMGSRKYDCLDPSISLRFTRGDRTMHNSRFTMHNDSAAQSFCHLERSVSGAERSRHGGTFTLAVRTGSR